MKVALINPYWTYDHSIYFGCREPHLPLEFGYAKAILERDGHDVLMLDGQLQELDNQNLADAAARFGADMTVVVTAPTYLFWRCAPPELRVPRDLLDRLGTRGGRTVAIGPHGSATPVTTLKKLDVDIVVRGECEEAICELANASEWTSIAGTAYRLPDGFEVIGPNRAASFVDYPALHWPTEWLANHGHHHHRFDEGKHGIGAEVEASRGCPYHCSFCAKIDYRDAYRRRNLQLVLEEIDGLIAQGVQYIYFIDEIFLPQRPLLEALTEREIEFGVQTRIDLWKPDMIELLGAAGCVSIEAGLESLTVEGREQLSKRCKLETEDLAALLIKARERVPFVQANLIGVVEDDPALVKFWREHLARYGVWANEPVPLYPYPSSPDYRRIWGEPDEIAWERAHEHYLASFQAFSDIQDQMPASLRELEAACHRA